MERIRGGLYGRARGWRYLGWIDWVIQLNTHIFLCENESRFGCNFIIYNTVGMVCTSFHRVDARRRGGVRWAICLEARWAKMHQNQNTSNASMKHETTTAATVSDKCIFSTYSIWVRKVAPGCINPIFSPASPYHVRLPEPSSVLWGSMIDPNHGDVSIFYHCFDHFA